MGHGFGQFWKYRGIITYRLSPFELKAFGGVISHGVPNTLRRIMESVPYIVPPIVLGYTCYDQIEKRHHQYMLKNPADFENEQ